MGSKASWVDGFPREKPSTQLEIPILTVALADSVYLQNLAKLDLSNNWIEAEGVKALVDSVHLQNLTELNLSHNKIGDEGARALVASKLSRIVRF